MDKRGRWIFNLANFNQTVNALIGNGKAHQAPAL